MTLTGHDRSSARSTRKTIVLRLGGTQTVLLYSTRRLKAVFALDDLRQRAIAGEPEAQAELALRLLNGDGVPKNKREGRTWCRQAAEQGDPLGQFLLGGCYYNGEGGFGDPLRALFWFSLAAEQGVKEALVIRRLMTPRLTLAQNLEVKRLMRAWRPVAGKPGPRQSGPTGSQVSDI
jgi:TPR repeat protein